ncbi:MAG: chemotaxis protein CheD [Desulfococcaceae bacterium]
MPRSGGPASHRDRKIIRIHIGEYYASRQSRVVYTLLGSCVAVCLYDPIRRVGGMNHILMPGKADLKNFDASARYGINAMELLINRIMNLGGRRESLRAKVFGGARTLSTIPLENSMGPKNEAFAVEFLERESIPIVSRDLGGNRSRRIYFHTDSGDVYLKRGKPIQLTTIPVEEQKVRDRVAREVDQKGDVTLF